MTDLDITVHGEGLTLLPERALFWKRTRTLLVADAHWGKAASFRAAGVPVPRGTTTDALTRLDAMLDRTGARRIVFLGDLLHAREGRSPETLRVVAEWRREHDGVAMLLVRGNHDRHAGDPPATLRIDCVDAPVLEPPFIFAHHPGSHPAGYVLAGHRHPAAFLIGDGRLRERLACFWFMERGAVLPAFGDFTGLAEITAHQGDRVFVIAEGEIMQVGERGRDES
jgi:DNA ligase-associated metallophosphoesterase